MLLMNDDTKTKMRTSPSKFVFPKTSKKRVHDVIIVDDSSWWRGRR